MPAAGSAHSTRTAIRASSGAANEFSSVPHTLGRKRKVALGTEDSSKRGPWGGTWGVALSHPVTMEIAVSFLGTGNVTYFLVTRKLLQHLDGKRR